MKKETIEKIENTKVYFNVYSCDDIITDDDGQIIKITDKLNKLFDEYFSSSCGIGCYVSVDDNGLYSIQDYTLKDVLSFLDKLTELRAEIFYDGNIIAEYDTMYRDSKKEIYENLYSFIKE